MQATALVIATLLLSGCLSKCPFPDIINNGSQWNQKDLDALQTARRRCGELYPDGPCVKQFQKTRDNQYRVICGRP